MKRKSLLLVLILSIFVSTISYAKVPSPSKDFYVYDEMKVLSSQTKDDIMRTNIEIEGKTKAQIVVATVNDLKGQEAFDYSVEMFRDWGIGDSKLNNGVLILLAYQPTEGNYKIEIRVGGGLEGILNDGKVGRIIDEYFAPNFDKKDESTFDESLKETFNAVVSQVITEYNIEIDGDYEKYLDNLDSDDGEFTRIIVIMAIIIAISIFANKNNKNNHNNRNRRGPFGGGYYGGFGGGFGGSSGRSGSGGFSGGGFSGGGGSTGGGGAGRSF